MTDEPLTPDSPGLVICDITSRDTGYAPRFVTRKALARAAEALPARVSEVEGHNYALELSPGAIRVTRRGGASSSSRPGPPRKRRAIESWSPKSRARMVARLCTLDYSTMFQDAARVPAMITLTYPGDWQQVAPNSRTVKRHLKVLRARYERKWGEPLAGVWKVEFQKRGAPHVHILAAPPMGAAFRSWLSETWAEVVDHPDQSEKAKHRVAGTGVDYAKGLRAFDAKRVAVYFSKHGSAGYGSKEYQNRVPALWLDAGDVGRFWGYWILRPAIERVEVTEHDALLTARLLRRWSRANSKSRVVVVDRVCRRTGVVKRRRVRRRAPARISGRLGFVSVNDGAALGTELGRYLRTGQV